MECVSREFYNPLRYTVYSQSKMGIPYLISSDLARRCDV